MFSCSQDKQIKVWSLETNECVQTLIGHRDTVNCIAMLPDGRLLSFSDDCNFKIWNLENGKCSKTMKAHSGGVLSLKKLSNSRLATGSVDEIKIWSLNDDMKCIQTIKTNSVSDDRNTLPFISGFVELSNGNLVSSGYDKCIKVWDINKKECLKTIVAHSDRINGILLLKNGKIATCSNDKTIKVWKADQLKLVKTLNGHTSSVMCLDETSKEQIVSGSKCGTIKVWDLKNNNQNCIQTLIVKDYQGKREIECIQYYQDDLVLCSGFNRYVQIWNIVTGVCVQTLAGHSNHISHLLLA